MRAPEQAVTAFLGALMPFTQGLGVRTVVFTLQGEHLRAEGPPRWSVGEARTLEPPPAPREVADFNQEYRELHEHILVEFQEQSRHYAVLAASITLEQLAYTVVGGMLIKRALVLIEVAAPTVTAVLARGGKGAVNWFRTLLVRAAPEERALLQQLWMKVETQGLKSLTVAEKQQLSGLMGRLERVLGTPLDDYAKTRLRDWARQDYFTVYNPRLAQVLGQEMKVYQVHHLCPLEYAHLFPKLEINGGANITAVQVDVHRSINAAWRSLGGVSDRMRPEDVTQAMEIINRHYGRWFGKVFNPGDASALASAKQGALAELAVLKTALSP